MRAGFKKALGTWTKKSAPPLGNGTENVRSNFFLAQTMPGTKPESLLIRFKTFFNAGEEIKPIRTMAAHREPWRLYRCRRIQALPVWRPERKADLS